MRADEIGGCDRRCAALCHHAVDEDLPPRCDTVRHEVGRVSEHELQVWIVSSAGVDEPDNVMFQMVGDIHAAHPAERDHDIGPWNLVDQSMHVAHRDAFIQLNR